MSPFRIRVSQLLFSKTILNWYIIFKGLFNRVGQIPLQEKITHFHSPLKPTQTKSRRVPLNFLESLKVELNRTEQEGHFVKLSKNDKNCFISPILITTKKDGSIKLALDS